MLIGRPIVAVGLCSWAACHHRNSVEPVTKWRRRRRWRFFQSEKIATDLRCLSLAPAPESLRHADTPRVYSHRARVRIPRRRFTREPCWNIVQLLYFFTMDGIVINLRRVLRFIGYNEESQRTKFGISKCTRSQTINFWVVFTPISASCIKS